MLTGDRFKIFHEYVENIMGRPVYTHEMAMFLDEIKEKAKADFIALCAEQDPKTEWIRVSKRLPEEWEWYLAVFKEKDTGYQLIPRVADYIGKGENKWRVIDEEGLCQEYRDILECIAWMPLPNPYEPQESEGEK